MNLLTLSTKLASGILNHSATMITHASTFSGIGAPEVAAEMLGWENVFHCEINPFGRRVLDYYFPKAKSYEDITRTDFSEWRDRISVLTGGFPCQPFSYAGRRRGSEDDRYLWPFMLRCIEQVRPRWFVGENVAGITTMAFPGEDVKVGEQTDLFGACDEVYEKHERYVLDEICQSLERAGYSVQPMLIPACAVGAPHGRNRIFIIAHDEMAMSSTNTDSGHDECRESRKSESTMQEERLQERDAVQFAEQSTCVRQEVERPSAYSYRELLGAGYDCGESDWKTSHRVKPYSCEDKCGGIEDAWSKFPSLKPTLRGRDDGLPFPVDRLTIPFTKWREQALKAYGNAIVPQVMYEIFRCIDEIEKTLNPE